MTYDFRGPKRPQNDPLDSVTNFLSSLGGVFSEALEDALDNVPGRKSEATKSEKLPVEVKFLEDGVLAKFDLPPGVKGSDVVVTLEEGTLRVSVTRNSSESSPSDFSDRASRFGRSVELDSSRVYEPVSAGIVNGVLEVALSSRNRVRVHTIPVTFTQNTAA